MVDGVLQGTASALEWTSLSTPIVEAVNEVEFTLGATIADQTNLRTLRALARVEAWRAAVHGTADRFRVSSDGQTVDLQQTHDHAVAMLRLAEDEYAVILAGGSGSYHSVGVTQVTYEDDPYGAASTEEWE